MSSVTLTKMDNDESRSVIGPEFANISGANYKGFQSEDGQTKVVSYEAKDPDSEYGFIQKIFVQEADNPVEALDIDNNQSRITRGAGAWYKTEKGTFFDPQFSGEQPEWVQG